MRHLGLCAVLLGACIPDEPDWLATAPRFRGIEVEVVEPGGYSTQLDVPPGRRRATALPLDTVELEWKVALPPGAELQPPIWVACSPGCFRQEDDGRYRIDVLELAALADCPQPLPISLSQSCRLGEGHRLRVGLAGAFTVNENVPSTPRLLVIGSREPDLSPATCLERLATRPLPPASACLFGSAWLPIGPRWAALPFDGEQSGIAPELLAQEPDTHPELTGFTVTRERHGERVELHAEVGGDIPVRRGDRITVTPRFAPGSEQEYWYIQGNKPDTPGTLTMAQERLGWQAWFSALVDDYDPPGGIIQALDPSWVVPHDVVPTTLFLDVTDGRDGWAFAELQFVPDPAQ